MMKIVFSAILLISASLYSQSIEQDRVKSDFSKLSLVDILSKTPQAKSPSFEVENVKYNQQNIALRKIKVNEYQPDMDNTALLIVEKGDINFYVEDLRANGFNATAYQDNNGYYFIAVDLTGTDVASQALGLAKYYYVKEVLVSRKVYNELFNVSRTTKNKSYATRIGSITGTMNLSPVDITINKIDWTIKGGINLSPVDLKINHNDKTITGVANNIPVYLRFIFSTEEIAVEGVANNSPIKYTVNWEKGLLEGYFNNNEIRLNFNMNEGVAGANIVNINGYANFAPVKLSFDKISGELKGYMNNAAVEVKLQNCDLYDFLNYIFIFIK